jgi:hypothetical protein
MQRAVWTALGALLVMVVLATPVGEPYKAQAVGELTPNLVALAPSELHLSNEGGRTYLRFTTTSWNNGLGPLELFVKPEEAPSGGLQKVYQRIYLDGGGSAERLAGQFEWHPAHDHFHFEGYANYVLSAPGLTPRTAQKTSFCVMDTTRVDHRLPGASKRATYTTCGQDVQGMSVGWGDAYRYNLAGQEIDVSGLPSGVYRLTIDIDPWNALAELNDNGDNTVAVDVVIDFAAGTAQIVGGGSRPGRGNGPR